MNIDLWLAQWQAKGLHFWQSLNHDELYYIWAGAGGVLLLMLFWFSHLVMRKAFGHRKFRGTWYNEQQFETLVKMIDEDSARGNRVMRHDEMKLLRQLRFGSAKTISDRAKGYF